MEQYHVQSFSYFIEQRSKSHPTAMDEHGDEED
jgi:hypothetical protein